MSFAVSAALQEAVYAALTGSAELAALVGGRVYDAPVHADAPEGGGGAYLTLGDERVQAWTAQGLDGAIHDLEIGVHTGDAGFAEGKRIGAAVAAALTGEIGALSVGRVATADFLSARTRRVKDGGRRIDLRFRFRVEA